MSGAGTGLEGVSSMGEPASDISSSCWPLDFAGVCDHGIGTPGEDGGALSDLSGVEPGEYPFCPSRSLVVGGGSEFSLSLGFSFSLSSLRRIKASFSVFKTWLGTVANPCGPSLWSIAHGFSSSSSSLWSLGMLLRLRRPISLATSWAGEVVRDIDDESGGWSGFISCAGGALAPRQQQKRAG